MKLINKKHILLPLIFILIIPFLSNTYTQSNSKDKGGPLPVVNVDGLPEFLKLLAFSSRNIAEGDFEEAILILKKAEKFHPNDPMLLEYFGLAYDGDRNKKQSFSHFLRAGYEYFKINNIRKSWKMIGWLKTINNKSRKVIDFENKVRKRQLILNQKRNSKKK